MSLRAAWGRGSSASMATSLSHFRPTIAFGLHLWLPGGPPALTVVLPTVAGRGAQFPVNKSTGMPGRQSVGKFLSSPHQSWGDAGHHQSRFQRRPSHPCWPRQGHVHSQGQTPSQPRALHRTPPCSQSRAHGLEALSALKSGSGVDSQGWVWLGSLGMGPHMPLNRLHILTFCLAPSHHPPKPPSPWEPKMYGIPRWEDSLRNRSPVPGGSSRT